MAELFLDKKAIQARVKHLAYQLVEPMRVGNWTAVIVMDGAMPFALDLLREIDKSIPWLTVSAKTYNGRAAGLTIVGDLPEDFHGQNLLVIDDVLDTGQTLETIWHKLKLANAGEIRFCVMVDKMLPEATEVRNEAFVGQEFNTDAWLVGYGMDADGLHREKWSIEVWPKLDDPQ